MVNGPAAIQAPTTIAEMQELTSTPTETEVVTSTEAPTQTPTSTPTATPEPTPTFSPEIDWDTVSGALHDGDYARVIAHVSAVIGDATEAERPALRVALGRAYVAENRYPEAVEALLPLLDEAEAGESQIEGLGLLARAYEAAGEWSGVVAALQRLIELDDLTAPYAQWRLIKAYEAMGNTEQMIAEINAAQLDALPASTRAEALEMLATAYRRQSRYDDALAAYDRILSFAQNAPYRATIIHRRGETLLDAGRADEAVQQFRRVLDTHADTAAAALSLGRLDDLGLSQVDDLQRGLIAYHAGQYDRAVQVLSRYADENPDGDPGRARYFVALSYGRLGQYAEAYREYDAMIQSYPEHPLVGDARIGRALAAASAGEDAIGLYSDFVQQHPQHSRAPEALWRAGETLERAGRWEEAAGFYRRLHREYPGDSRAAEAHFREALGYYAAGNLDAAYDIWSPALEQAPNAEERARLHTWLGKIEQARGDTAAADKHWSEAARISPWSYYGLRAQDLQNGYIIRLAADVPTDVPDDRFTDADWQEIATWIDGWYTAESSGDVMSGTRGRRAMTLWRLGWQDEALALFRAIRDDVRDNPWGLLSLARAMREEGIYSISIYCGDRLAILGNAAGAPPPTAVSRLSYPTAYGHLVSTHAQRRALDPFLFLSLIRQESRFDSWAISRSGASGLTQVMPATGAWIAERINDNTYHRDMLYRPVVSVNYGTWYIRHLLDLYDNDWVAALAAYNAGPGNLQRWTGGEAIADHDLFYETIPMEEPKSYVRLIYQQYRRYEQIYRR
ncbi:MAG: transglycosylase SLT domain-containing protein [Anaerolineae bacterium]